MRERKHTELFVRLVRVSRSRMCRVCAHPSTAVTNNNLHHREQRRNWRRVRVDRGRTAHADRLMRTASSKQHIQSTTLCRVTNRALLQQEETEPLTTCCGGGCSCVEQQIPAPKHTHIHPHTHTRAGTEKETAERRKERTQGNIAVCVPGKCVLPGRSARTVSCCLCSTSPGSNAHASKAAVAPRAVAQARRARPTTWQQC